MIDQGFPGGQCREHRGCRNHVRHRARPGGHTRGRYADVLRRSPVPIERHQPVHFVTDRHAGHAVADLGRDPRELMGRDDRSPVDTAGGPGLGPSQLGERDRRRMDGDQNLVVARGRPWRGFINQNFRATLGVRPQRHHACPGHLTPPPLPPLIDMDVFEQWHLRFLRPHRGGPVRLCKQERSRRQSSLANRRPVWRRTPR